MMYRCLFIFGLMLPLLGLSQGYKIELDIDSYDGDTLYLGYYFGDKQYLKDTAVLENNKFVFDGDEPLDQGMYLIVLPPDNDIYEIIINEDQNFQVSLNHAQGISSMQINGNEENSSFLQYLRLLRDLKPIGNRLNEELSTLEPGSEHYNAVEDELNNLGKQVDEKRDELNLKFPESILSLIIHSSDQIKVPEFEEIIDPDERKMKRFLYYKKHYFDAFDLNDERLIRTPFFLKRVDYFLDELTVQIPDSITKSIDFLMHEFSGNDEMFKFHLIHVINKYAQSKVVGFDAVYVHIVDQYYAKDLASWVDQEQLDKMIKNSNTLKPILIGKTAPDIVLKTMEGKAIRLHSIESEYTILYFWDPDCGHCKKSIPKMIDFYEKYKNQGVAILAVCTKLTDKVPSCWEAVKDRGMDIWVNAADAYLRSRYKQVYDIRSTPMIYVLDENKTILSKKIASTQLEEVINKLKELKAQEKL